MLGGALASTELNKSKKELITFLINHRNFLASQFNFITKEDDINLCKEYL